MWSIILSGGIPALSTPFPVLADLRIKHITHLDQLLNQPLYLTNNSLVDQFSDIEGLNIQSVEELQDQDSRFAANKKLFNRNSLPASSSPIAMLMLTSGSTGNAKAVPLTHKQILASLSGKMKSCGGTEAHMSVLNWIGFDHVAAVEAHFLSLLSGGDQIHVHASDIVTQPLLFLKLIQKHAVTRSFAPNFFLEKLRRCLDMTQPKQLDLSSWKILISGGEAIVSETLSHLSRLLGEYGAATNLIVPAFGMTETFAGCIFNSDMVHRSDSAMHSPFMAVGRCMEGIELRITPNSNVVDGTSGNLEVRGSVICSEYFNDPQATSEAFTDDKFFKTGDLGYINADGSLQLVGRAKETILINGLHYHPDMIERALEDAHILGITPGFTLAFDYRENNMATENVLVVYLPSHDAEDAPALLATHDEIVKVVMSSTQTCPLVLPLDETILQRSSLGKLPRIKIKNHLRGPEMKVRQTAYESKIRSQRELSMIAPGTKMEGIIHEILSEYLHLPIADFGVQSPIFDLGVSSIDILQLKSQLEKRLDKVIETGTILQSPNIRSLAKALDETSVQSYTPIVVLQPYGKGIPLWLVHPGVGDVLVFLELAKNMDRPVYALRARGFRGEGYFKSIPEAAETYFSAIKSEQAEGPYALAGYCYGAMLAFETSKILESNNDEVRFLGSFDLPPHIAWRMRQLDWVACLTHLSFFVDLITEDYSHEILPQLRKCNRKEALQHIIDVAHKRRWNELALSADALYSWTTLAHELHVMAVDYNPTGSVQCIDVFYAEPLRICASTKKDWAAGPLKDWESFSRGKLELHDCPGGHYTMIGPDYVKEFADILKNVLSVRGL